MDMGPGQSSSCSRAADVPLSDVEVYEFFRRYGVHVRANEGQDNQGNRLPQVVPASQDTDSFQNTFGFRGVLDEDEIFQTYAELPDDTHLPFVIPSVNDMDVEIEELQTKIRGLQEKLDSLSQENLQLRKDLEEQTDLSQALINTSVDAFVDGRGMPERIGAPCNECRGK